MIAHRKGFGDVLADGVIKAADRVGGIAREFADHVKRLEPPAHDPRAKMTVAVGFATSNRGACHLQAFTHDFEEGTVIEDLGSPRLPDRFTQEGKAENVERMLSEYYELRGWDAFGIPTKAKLAELGLD